MLPDDSDKHSVPKQEPKQENVGGDARSLPHTTGAMPNTASNDVPAKASGIVPTNIYAARTLTSFTRLSSLQQELPQELPQGHSSDGASPSSPVSVSQGGQSTSSSQFSLKTIMHRSFEDSLDKLRSRLIRMGSLVEEQVEFAVRAVLENKREFATIVMERDDKVDKLDMKIDKQCQRIFALTQPVAGDLRLLLVALKMNNDLERIGDMAYNISRYMTEIQTNCAELAAKIALDKLTQATFTMVKGALDSFVNNDPNLAYQIMRTDDHVDNLSRESTKQMIALIKQQPDIVEDGIAMITIIRNLERMADQATNIAENVVFLVEAKLVRYALAMKAEEGRRLLHDDPDAEQG
jgi:phosphate transport system protein